MWGSPSISQPDNNRNGKGNLPLWDPPAINKSGTRIDIIKMVLDYHMSSGRGILLLWDPLTTKESLNQTDFGIKNQGNLHFVQSHGQHQRVQELQQQHTTPLTRKPQKGQRNQRQNQRQTQHNWDPQVPSYNPKGYHNRQMRNVDPHQQPQQNNYGEYNPRQYHQHQNFDFHNHRQVNRPWTSTPRDQNSRYNTPRSQSLFGETATNNSLLNILDTQCKVQQETTQALSTIIKLQDTRANDAFLSDLHSFNGKPDEFLKWIAAIERVANVTGRPARELATAKAEGAVFKCLQGITYSTDWEGCKKILRESFSNIQTKEHANSFLMGRSQRPSESLQEFIHVFCRVGKDYNWT